MTALYRCTVTDNLWHR